MGRSDVRAVTSEGEVLWQQQSPGVPLMGDSFGGVLAGLWTPTMTIALTSGLAAAVRGHGAIDSPGTLGRPAQASDGTIYTIEQLSGGLDMDGKQIWDKYAMVLDGATGGLISRTLLAREVDEFNSDRDGVVVNTTPPTLCRSTHYEQAPADHGGQSPAPTVVAISSSAGTTSKAGAIAPSRSGTGPIE